MLTFSLKNINEQRDIRRQNETVGTQVISTEVVGTEQTRTFTENINRGDPLAQTFVVEDDTGIFITKCDVFFEQVDNLEFLSFGNLEQLRMEFQLQIFYHCLK